MVRFFEFDLGEKRLILLKVIGVQHHLLALLFILNSENTEQCGYGAKIELRVSSPSLHSVGP